MAVTVTVGSELESVAVMFPVRAADKTEAAAFRLVLEAVVLEGVLEASEALDVMVDESRVGVGTPGTVTDPS